MWLKKSYFYHFRHHFVINDKFSYLINVGYRDIYYIGCLCDEKTWWARGTLWAWGSWFCYKSTLPLSQMAKNHISLNNRARKAFFFSFVALDQLNIIKESLITYLANWENPPRTHGISRSPIFKLKLRT